MSERVQPAVDNLLVDYVVADNVADGHPFGKFVGRKRASHVCSREHRWTLRGEQPCTQSVQINIPICKCKYTP